MLESQFLRPNSCGGCGGCGGDEIAPDFPRWYTVTKSVLRRQSVSSPLIPLFKERLENEYPGIATDRRVLQLSSALASLGWYLERRENEVAGLTTAERGAIEARIRLKS